MMPAAMLRRVPLALSALAAAGLLAACGSQGISVKDPNANIQRGAELFAARCSGCHNLDVVGAQGGAQKVKDRERTDGPNFNVRKEDVNSVLYALRNGGFSGAIMPENIVVGHEAQDVAAFLAKYSGLQSKKTGNQVPGSQPPASQGSAGG
ncbi:MAG: cytochrome c [Solirubrobacterales bacterium]|jgi:mono/diheme cytochrome c family protein|nr:cytochrome c [Solirubrobacterales bacterium]